MPSINNSWWGRKSAVFVVSQNWVCSAQQSQEERLAKVKKALITASYRGHNIFMDSTRDPKLQYMSRY